MNPFDQFDAAANAFDGPPKTGMGEAVQRGVQSGVTMNFGDEMRGVLAAGGGKVGSDTEPAGPHNLLVGAYRLLVSGDPEARKIYDETVARERDANERARRDHTGAYLAGEIGGSVVLPGGAAMRGATLPARMGRSAAVGAGYGAASGAGAGETLPERATGAVTGGAIGGTVGAAAPPLVEGTIQGARIVTAPVRRAFAGATNPDAEAGRRIVTAIERDNAADPNATTRLTRQEFDDARQAGQPVMLADLGGPLTRRVADSAAITSPEGGQALNRTINDRFEGQSGRITQWLNHSFNFPNADAQRQALEQTARSVNRPAYMRAFQQHDGPMWDEALSEIAQDPVMQSAIRRASAAVRTDRTLAGYRPMNSPFTFEESSGRLMLRRDSNGQTIYPDLRFWDLVKRELDKQGTRESASFARTLRNHLDELTTDEAGQSAYRTARQGAASFFGAEDALEAGQNFVGASARYGLDEARRALQRMTPTQRALFQDGYVSRFVEALEKSPDRRNVLNQIASSPAARAELDVALGRQRATELEARLRVEGVMDLIRGSVQGNSWTARRLYDLGLAGGAGGLTSVGAYNQDPSTMAIGAMMGALAGGRHYIDQRVARRVAEMLVSDDPAILQRGVALVARNQRLLNALRETDKRIAVAGGVQAGGE